MRYNSLFGVALSENAQAQRIVADVPCPACACLCDDLQIAVSGGRIVSAVNACEKGRQLFLSAGGDRGFSCRVDGKPAAIDAAIGRAAEILTSALYPLVWGFGRASCEAQAAAIEIAERVGGVVDCSGSGDLDSGRLEALQTVGEVSCTLGEIRSRADLIVVWNADPQTDLPRFFERYGPKLLGKPGGCPLVVVDSRSTATAKIATRRLKIRAGGEFEAANVLWALAKQVALEPKAVEQRTGVPLAQWQSLAETIEQSKYVAILFGTGHDATPFAEPLYGFVRTVNDRTRCVCLRLAEVSNSNGAEQVLAWRTGFPRTVDFSHGFPRSNAAEFSANRLLERGEADAALIVCDDADARLSGAACARLKQIPVVSIDWREAALSSSAEVSIPVAVPGVESPGTMFRMDGVPLALRPPLAASGLSDTEVLRKLLSAVSV